MAANFSYICIYLTFLFNFLHFLSFFLWFFLHVSFKKKSSVLFGLNRPNQTLFDQFFLDQFWFSRFSVRTNPNRKPKLDFYTRKNRLNRPLLTPTPKVRLDLLQSTRKWLLLRYVIIKVNENMWMVTLIYPLNYL